LVSGAEIAGGFYVTGENELAWWLLKLEPESGCDKLNDFAECRCD